jgi:hypothetical protein
MKSWCGEQWMAQLQTRFIIIALWALHLGCAVRLRNSTAQVRAGTAQLIAKQHAVGTFLSSLDSPCVPKKNTVNLLSGKVLQDKSVKSTTKLRVCNAATTARTALLTVSHNSKQLNADYIGQRECVEFVIAIEVVTNIEIKLSGEVISGWSMQKSEAEMQNIPVLFLVAYVFGQGKGATFTVNEFHGENTGLNSVQVAYMDILRHGPAADLQLISPGGSFQVSGGTYVHVCAGDYSIKFVQHGSNSASTGSATGDTTLATAAGEQYVVLRIAPDGAHPDRQMVITFPKSGGWKQAGVASWLLAAFVTRILLQSSF